jgi:hypothetical protein
MTVMTGHVRKREANKGALQPAAFTRFDQYIPLAIELARWLSPPQLPVLF